MSKILVVGDVHANFGVLNNLINKKSPDIILQVGDFGFWPGSTHWTQVKCSDTKIYFCDGNHEDHHLLGKCRQNNNFEVQPNVFYMPRGRTMTLPDGRNVLFMGGAWSPDYKWRTDGLDWFEKAELISQNDIDNILPNKIDIVISHTAPHEFELNITGEHFNDISRKFLSDVLFTYKPKLWYFGHWHLHKRSRFIFIDGQECKWFCLNRDQSPGWWEELKH